MKGGIFMPNTDSFEKEMDNLFQPILKQSKSLSPIYDQFKKIAGAVYEVDSAMADLASVTSEADSIYEAFLTSAQAKAQDLGRTISSLLAQTTSWARQGFDLKQSAKLAEYSSIYSNISGVGDQTAISDMAAAMKAFNLTADESIRVVDALARLGKDFDISTAGLGEGLRTSASTLAMAGNDMNQSLAMLTGMTKLTGDATEAGNALNVLALRFMGMKDALNALGEDTTGVESIRQTQAKLLDLSNNTVDIFDYQGNLKSTYEIISDIARVWSEMSQVDQSQMLNLIAGNQHQSPVSALIQSFQSGQVSKALSASINSEGSALREQEQWLDTLEGKTRQLEASFQSLTQTLVSSDLLKFLVDLGTTGVNAVTGITDALTPLGTLGATLGAVLSSKNLGKCA